MIYIITWFGLNLHLDVRYMLLIALRFPVMLKEILNFLSLEELLSCNWIFISYLVVGVTLVCLVASFLFLFVILTEFAAKL